MQFTLFTYFQTSSKTFLLFVLLAHPVRSRLLHSTRYINYLLTYLLTYWDLTKFGLVTFRLVTSHREKLNNSDVMMT